MASFNHFVMREIIFRGKRLDTREWVYGGISIFNGEATIYNMNEINNAAYDVDIDTVGEYSTLCDKNGTKIFKGDKVRFKRSLQMSDEYFEVVEVVTFVLGCLHIGSAPLSFWSYDRNEDNEYIATHRYWIQHGSFEDTYYVDCDLEVVGSIHDNPELLKGGDNG